MLPERMAMLTDKKKIDKVRGVIFGHAIGDAFGIGTEFLSKQQVSAYYPGGLHHYDQIVRDQHRQRWSAGDWTDDTDQMLCILDSILDNATVDHSDIAFRIYQWARGGGMGIGHTVRSVVYSTRFLDNPHEAARIIWECSGRWAAANGGIMRTSVLGVWKYDKPEFIRRNAESVCKITHYDPRCVGSCVLISLVISSIIRGEKDLGEIVDCCASDAVSNYDSRIETYAQLALRSTLDALDLDEGLNPGERNKIGYTLKAMGAGLWALLHAESYEEGVFAVIHEGGDADSNGAVAGALLGAKFGYNAIPVEWIDGLSQRSELSERVEKLIEMM